MNQNNLVYTASQYVNSSIESDLDPQYMRRAIELALSAKGRTNPNPMVGAVIVKDGRVIGEGYHHRYGDLHAERDAIKNLKNSAQGATIYVTLEPCCHYGKQPPCTLAIVEAGISRVVIGSRDPNPLVSGQGAAFLRKNGIEVIEDYLREECDGINPVFFHYIVNKEPYVALKYAMTADGRIATDFGDSKWITGQRARAYVHDLRSYYTGILAGIGTVLADDPLLTCRLPGGRNPIRIIMDSHLKIPLDCNLVKSINEAPLIVACLDKYLTDNEAIRKKIATLKSMGVTVLGVAAQGSGGFTQYDLEDDHKDNHEEDHKENYKADHKAIPTHETKAEWADDSGEHISVEDLLYKLGKLKIDGILVEGGKHINAAFIAAGKVNKIYTFVGAQIVGGSGTYTPVADIGISKMEESIRLSDPEIRAFDTDVLIEYEVQQKYNTKKIKNI
ncbi:bifunctional diaminohydroxyphosphoribosylaminopyrimidine deaminase/5-amino-6-(5-phosphoribosylamino)uracil reductase RibD [Butyrivibrio fibrisolvens]|uniref:bifunctional diaminohydroxyphosphoribosylaminopyrimidine deaminase/5-amino-6-(5-phosphoribosylamino)uracil reductase RibD n=1 Tax=Butyrivibrio fibrisolvens TaxID=831 RepID=UPI0003FF78C0|nr:bifunctional diaminohydroxyphosphoribosylaminopyrimidine deaminase/5-amino-6-(5-phosphoribosylamino)uracil reductase RibD [Butyrivibrio fibrisolvens]